MPLPFEDEKRKANVFRPKPVPVVVGGGGVRKHSELEELDVSGHPAAIIDYDNMTSGLKTISLRQNDKNPLSGGYRVWVQGMYLIKVG